MESASKNRELSGSLNYNKRPSLVRLKIQAFRYQISVICTGIGKMLFGSGGKDSALRIKPPVLPEKVVDKKPAKVYKFEKPKKKKRKKKKKIKKETPSIGMPSVVSPSFNWIVFKPFAIVVSKYIGIFSLCFAVTIFIIWIFSGTLLEILIDRHQVFENERLREIVIEEVTPTEGRVESIKSRLSYVEGVLDIKTNKNLRPRKKRKRKYRVMNSRSKRKYVWR